MTATMPRPGQSVTVTTSPYPSTPVTKTGTWFVAGPTEKGPLKATKVESLADFVNKFGGKLTFSTLYDDIDEYFSDGGALAYIGRVVGTTAKVAELVLKDTAVAESLKAIAKGPGEYYNQVGLKITNTAESVVVEVFLNKVLVETSPALLTQNEAILWSQLSPYFEFVLGVSVKMPATLAETVLAGGADGKGAITDATWKNGLNLFGKSLGPGQVTESGRTTTQANTDTLAHAFENNRFAILNGPQSGTASTVEAAAAAQRGTNDIYGALFAPWITIPGVLPGTTRFVSPASFVAAKIAASDGEGKSPNRPAAGLNGRSIRAIGLEQLPFNNGSGAEVTRDAMYSAGVNIIWEDEGFVEIYGWRCLTSPTGALQDWLNAGNDRLRMAIVAKANFIAKKYVLDEIDGQGKVFKEFEGELKAMLAEYWQMGSLYGATSEQAFSVNVGPSVNTPESINNKEMKAAIALRMSPDAEMVTIVISKVPITQTLP